MMQRTNAVLNISEANLPDDRVMSVVRAASDKKATQIVVLDLHGIATFTDYFVICNGRSGRQVQAITDEISERLSKEGVRALHVEGYKTAEWVLIDYGDFIVHVFAEEARRFYDLERLWRDADKVEIRDE